MIQYYFTGPDGSGKSTYIKLLEKYFDEKRLETQYIWIRSPKIFSKPLMLYCRIAGYTKYKYVDNVKYGVHEFYRSKFVSNIFPIIQLVDFYIKNTINQIKIRKKKGDIIVYDRHALDTLADLMVGTKRFDLHKKTIGKLFIKLLPKNVKIIVLEVQEDIIRSRKIDTLHDINLANKIKVYKILSKDLSLDIIDNSYGNQNIVFNNIKKKLSLV